MLRWTSHTIHNSGTKGMTARKTSQSLLMIKQVRSRHRDGLLGLVLLFSYADGTSGYILPSFGMRPCLLMGIINAIFIIKTITLLIIMFPLWRFFGGIP